MTDDDKKEFAVCITALAVAYGKEVDKVLIAAFWEFLKDLPLDSIKRATVHAARTLRFMPTVAELRELSGVITTKRRAVLAWDIVSAAAGSIGSYRSVHFGDPIINAAVRSLGGWPALLSRGGEDFDKWARKEFIDAYERLDGCVGPYECRPLSSLATSMKRPVPIECGYAVTNDTLRMLHKQSLEMEEDVVTQLRGLRRIGSTEIQ